MQLFAFGINHHTAPLSVRERVVFHAENLSQALLDLTARQQVKEAAIISTCNRTEIYCNTAEPALAIDWLGAYHHLPAQHLAPYLYVKQHEQVVKHAFRVASGLDSMVLGEPQILGQMKEAVRSAEQAGTMGALLHKLFQRTFSVAKEVRSQTDIGSSSVSMAAAAVRLAERIFPTIREQNVLFIGAGEMIDLCATHFAARNPKKITIANRTLARGHALAQRFNASAITLNELPEQLSQFDIIVTCTASQLPILGKGMLERAIKIRRHRPIFMVDLAVPRDIEPEVAQLNDVFLYSIDDLANIVKDGLDIRQTAVVQAEAIIDSRVASFLSWMESRSLVPTIRSLHEQADRIRQNELDKALRLLGREQSPEQVLEQLSRALTNKFLHIPTQALNNVNADEHEQLLGLLRQLYQLKS